MNRSKPIWTMNWPCVSKLCVLRQNWKQTWLILKFNLGMRTIKQNKQFACSVNLRFVKFSHKFHQSQITSFNNWLIWNWFQLEFFIFQFFFFFTLPLFYFIFKTEWEILVFLRLKIAIWQQDYYSLDFLTLWECYLIIS